MMHSVSSTPSCACRFATLRFVGGSLVVLAALSSASIAADVIRVEQDWELVVASTDSNSTAPQVSCAISPDDSVAGCYATLELNHRSMPDFASGGLHLQVWNGEDLISTHSYYNQNVMNGSNETVRWTQSVAVTNGVLTFDIQDGQSSTWSTFGNIAQLRRSLPTSRTHLNDYNSAVSVANSGVSYAGNRVTSLVLKRVRVFTSDGEVFEDETSHVVHSN